MGSLVKAGICSRFNSRMFNPSEIVDQAQALEFRDERVGCFQLRLQLVGECRCLVGIHALEIDEFSLEQARLGIEGVIRLFEPLLREAELALLGDDARCRLRRITDRLRRDGALRVGAQILAEEGGDDEERPASEENERCSVNAV